MAGTLAVNSGSILLAVALAVVFIGVGLFVLLRLYKNFQKAKQSQNWMTTPGKVLYSDLDIQRHFCNYFYRHWSGDYYYNAGQPLN